jgi:hypothetical protein
VLKKHIAGHAHNVTVDPFQKMPAEQLGTREPDIRRRDAASDDPRFVFRLLKTWDEIKISRAKTELEVSMRECEREELACRDLYERALERRAKKREQA